MEGEANGTVLQPDDLEGMDAAVSGATAVSDAASGTSEAAPGDTLARRSPDVYERALATMSSRGLAGPDNAVLLMVSGGSDSTALAYLAHRMREEGRVGAVGLLHVNHKLRGEDSDGDAAFVARLAESLELPCFLCEIDVAAEAARTGGNIEAVARHERYLAANEALESLCLHEAYPLSEGRIFTAHTADDRIENFYMRSIVGTGPGGFRSMLYRNGAVVRPLMDVSREDLRDYLRKLAAEGADVTRDGEGRLWREDATNAHTDRFRAFVRHEIVPKAKERNPRLTDALVRSMNLIADEDDMLDAMAGELAEKQVRTCAALAEGDLEGTGPAAGDWSEGFLLLPEFAASPLPLQRRAVHKLLAHCLGADERIDAATVEAVLGGFVDGAPNSGYVTNIQGDLAVSANKEGVRVEPMAYFRARRKRS